MYKQLRKHTRIFDIESMGLKFAVQTLLLRIKVIPYHLYKRHSTILILLDVRFYIVKRATFIYERVVIHIYIYRDDSFQTNTRFV